MNIQSQLKKLIPHAGILIGFIVISFLYFSPVIEGKKLSQMDLTHAIGQAQELVNFEKENPGETSQWTNSMFGGIPAYQIKGGKAQNVFVYLLRFLRFKLPYTTVAIMFNYLLGFYILLLCFNVNKWISAIGALGFAFASYNIVIIAVGHITKAYAIAYMAPIIGGIFLIYKRKYILGAILTLLFVGIQIATTHIQINYYTVLLIGVIVAVEFFMAIKKKELNHFFKATIILALCGVLAVLPETKKLWTTYEYSKYSIRGDQVLNKEKQVNADKGLEKDYALSWSYGKMESFTFLIPNFMGGGSVPLDKDTKVYDNLIQNGVQPQVAEAISKNTVGYWGKQPFTSAPVYFGSIIVFLFVLGLFLIDKKYKWWIVIGTVLSILLAWGQNFEFFTDFFFSYVPLYNKFRTVSMILVIANVTVVLMAILTLKEIYERNISKEKFKKSLLYTLEIVGGLLLFFILFAGALFSFEADSDLNLISQLQANKWPANLINAYREGLYQERLYMLRADSFRSLVFILLSVGLIYIYFNKKIKSEYFIAAIGLLILIDLWGVDKRYLNKDQFITAREEKNQFKLTNADQQILKDTGFNNRVLNLTKSPFNDAFTPYYHQSIGGYHGAKLRRYQDIIDYHLMPSIQTLVKVLNASNDLREVDNLLINQNVLNMLNTKYIILSDDFVLTNKSAFGNAWFIEKPLFTSSHDEVIQKIGQVDLQRVAVIHDEFKDLVGNKYSADTSKFNNIKLVSYKPNHLTYEVKAQKNGIAVFSEIYYPKGWVAYIDGKETDYFRANYILRAMVIPEGQHIIEFKFKPKSYQLGGTISLISSILVALLIIAGIIFLVKQKNQTDLVQEED